MKGPGHQATPVILLSFCVEEGGVSDSIPALQPPFSPFREGPPDGVDAASAAESVVEAEPVRPPYLVDLESAEAAERDLASGRGFIDPEGGADTPSDPIDDLRCRLPCSWISSHSDIQPTVWLSRSLNGGWLGGGRGFFSRPSSAKPAVYRRLRLVCIHVCRA
jgi:hypothetical protein